MEEEEEEKGSKEKEEGEGRWLDKLKDRWQKKRDENRQQSMELEIWMTEGNHTRIGEREKDGKTKGASEDGKKTWEKKVEEVIELSGEVDIEEEGHDGNEKMQPERRKEKQKNEILSLGDWREIPGDGRELERVEEEEREKVESQWMKREVRVWVGGQREKNKQIGGSDRHMIGTGERGKDGVIREKREEEGKNKPTHDNESGTGESGNNGVRSKENSNGGEKIWSDRNKSGTGEREKDQESEEEKDGRGKNWEDDEKERRGSEEEDGESKFCSLCYQTEGVEEDEQTL